MEDGDNIYSCTIDEGNYNQYELQKEIENKINNVKRNLTCKNNENVEYFDYNIIKLKIEKNKNMVIFESFTQLLIKNFNVNLNSNINCTRIDIVAIFQILPI